jgi:hypothetical protein
MPDTVEKLAKNLYQRKINRAAAPSCGAIFLKPKPAPRFLRGAGFPYAGAVYAAASSFLSCNPCR